ncbi:SOS response-associated peptidase [candidate division WOR-3 bacterium]|nr:SOS response-associated peptidase [candidate division WOR-3 bacterium]
MCARYCFTLTVDDIKKRYWISQLPSVPIRYNIPPGTQVPVVLNTSPDELQFANWGLVPSWSKTQKPSFKPINARAETVTEKPMFKSLVRSKRCVLLADSFFEWKKTNGKKIPYRIMMKDEQAFAFAGLWDSWTPEGRDEKELKTCLIITTEANELVAPIHDRMPVILTRDKERAWLEEVAPDDAWTFLRPYGASLMKAYEVSPEVNSPKNDSPSVIRPVNKLFE